MAEGGSDRSAETGDGFLERVLASDVPDVTKNIARLICERPDLCHPDGSPYQARCAKLFKMNQPTFNRIIKGESRNPRHKHLKPIADFFGLSVDDLYQTDVPMPSQTVSGLDPDEQALLAMYRLLPKPKRRKARAIISDLID